MQGDQGTPVVQASELSLQVGTPVVSIHSSCNPFNIPTHSAANPVAAAELADWMPAVQRHMDTSGVVPHLALSQDPVSTVSSLLASTSDYSFSQPGSRSGSRDAGHHEDEGSTNSTTLRCKRDRAQQVGTAPLHHPCQPVSPNMGNVHSYPQVQVQLTLQDAEDGIRCR